MNKRATAASHISKFFKLVEEPTDVEVVITNELLVIILLSSLPKKFTRHFKN